MYFVDRKRIDDVLSNMEELTHFLMNEKAPEDMRGKLSLERAVTVLIESIIDVGNQLIDGFIMRDPGGYEDIIDILEDEKVITSSDGESLKVVIRLRKPLAYEYTTIDHQALYEDVNNQLESLKQFPQHVQVYLKNELGVITAFIPEEK